MIIAVLTCQHDDSDDTCMPKLMIGLTHEELGALVEGRILNGDTAQSQVPLAVAVFSRRTDDEAIAYMEGAMGARPDRVFDRRPAQMPDIP